MDFIVVLAKVYPKEGCRDTVIELSEDLIETEFINLSSC